jgi:glutamate/tyrosine decarboxylase-like PLP-dependent enzyme
MTDNPGDGSRLPPEASPVDLASIFLGPKAENAEAFERLLLDAFRDHVFWRRNFHPEDGFLVDESEKLDPAYARSISVLRQELLGLLSELKRGVPFFSPRYSGHMSSDLTMASLVGYFATMLYNPNNVAAEASPVTTRMELEVASQLARMIGFPTDSFWGHLTSGGTVANFEAIWVARNVKYLPVAIRWAAEDADLELPVGSPDGTVTDIAALDLWQLLNLPPTASLDLLDRFRSDMEDPYQAVDLVRQNSLAGLGYQQFGLRLAAEFGDALPPAVVLVPSTGHYSWEKICRSLGIGGSNLYHVAVDDHFRMDPDALEEALRSLAQKRQPVIACVSVIGTTEESAVDRLDRVVELREWAGRELGICFHLHADAAYGGYAAAVTRNPAGGRRSYSEIAGGAATHPWPDEGTYHALCALEATDSVTIDPHKLGFVPYPAGAVLFRDARFRDLVAVEAPYLFHRGASEWGYIGRYIFEGSKPGAAAAAVWMSHKVLSLDAAGYGRLITETARGARALHAKLLEESWSPFKVVPLPAPDLNIVCFALGHPDLTTLAETNDFVLRVYQAMSVDPSRSGLPDYLVTKTVLRSTEYGRSALPAVEALGFDEEQYRGAGGLSVIRCTVMDPFLADRRGRADHVGGFAAALRTVLPTALRES